MKVIISIAQLLAYFAFYLPVRLLYQPQRLVAPSLRALPHGRYIIAANHQCWMDPFLVLSLMPLRTFFKLLPIRFITADQYMNTWWKYYPMTILGCFPVTPERNARKAAIEYACDLIRDGQTLFIFPEGKRLEKGEHTNAKRGVSVIAQRAQAHILPIQIDGMTHSQRRTKRTFRCYYGVPLILESQGNVLRLSGQLMEYVYSLYLNAHAYYGPRRSFALAINVLRAPVHVNFDFAYSAEDDARSIDMANHVLVPTGTG